MSSKNNSINDVANVQLSGFIQLIDPDSNELILAKKNAINYNKIANLISTMLTSSHSVVIGSVVYGNSGVLIDSIGNVTYKPTNTTRGSTLDLYNQIIEKALSTDTLTSVNNISIPVDPDDNSVDIVINSLLDYDELYNSSSDFEINELGLKTSDGELFSHVAFHPIQKTGNRKIKLVYTIRISVGL